MIPLPDFLPTSGEGSIGPVGPGFLHLQGRSKVFFHFGQGVATQLFQKSVGQNQCDHALGDDGCRGQGGHVAPLVLGGSFLEGVEIHGG